MNLKEMAEELREQLYGLLKYLPRRIVENGCVEMDRLMKIPDALDAHYERFAETAEKIRLGICNTWAQDFHYEKWRQEMLELIDELEGKEEK